MTLDNTDVRKGTALRFHSDLTVHMIEGEGLIVDAGLQDVVLDDAIFAEVFKHLPVAEDEDHLADLIKAADDNCDLTQAYYAIEVLKTRGILIDAQDSYCKEDTRAGILGTVKSHPPVYASFDIHRFGDQNATLLEAALGNAGLTRDQANPALSIVLIDDYLRVHEAQDALDLEGRAWIPLNLAGKMPLLGPFFSPDHANGCSNCLVGRVRFNRDSVALTLSQKKFTTQESGPNNPLTRTAADALFAAEIIRFMYGGQGADTLLRHVLSLHMGMCRVDRHVLLPNPYCQSCGEAAPKTLVIPVLNPRPKQGNSENGSRAEAPEETLSRLEKYVSPVIGLLKSVNNGSGSNLVHSCSVGQNLAVYFRDLKDFKRNLRAQSGGKGRSSQQARVSGICEGLERYSGLFQEDVITKKASFSELGSDAVDPRGCTLYSDAQYANRKTINKAADSFNCVPKPFDPDKPIWWSSIYSLTQERFKDIPTSYCYYRFIDTHSFSANSNGNAAGSSLEEAALQGMLELIERDAVAIWWYNRLHRPAIDLATLGDSYFNDLTRLYDDLNRDYWVLDLTHDLKIPTFAAICRHRADQENILFGFGSHLNPKVAIDRAITEMNQFMPMVVDFKNQNENIRFHSPQHSEWFASATLASDTYLAPQGLKSWTDVLKDAPPAFDDMLEEFLYCQRLLEHLGHEVLLLDQTRPDIELSVAKVVVPGLRHFWSRLAPGRLYDVPVAMGWQDAPHDEASLNPTALFI